MITCRRAVACAKCEEALGFECRHAVEAGGGDRLPIGFIGDVAGGEQAGHRGRRGVRRHRRNRKVSA